MNRSQALAFSQVLTAWNRREDARAAHDIRRLGAAREELELARAQMRLTTLSR